MAAQRRPKAVKCTSTTKRAATATKSGSITGTGELPTLAEPSQR